jgi:type III pantothenate kinase
MCAKALWSDTAKLPEFEIVKPKSILATETISSMQAGLVFGHIEQTEYIITKMKEETGKKNIRVIATGGLGGLISQNTKMIDLYNPTLTLEGMRFIHERNTSN